MPDGFSTPAAFARLGPQRERDGGFAAVINASASGMDRRRRAALSRLLSDTLGLSSDRLAIVDGAGLPEALQVLARTGPKAIAVCGGDGTMRTALEVLTPMSVATAPVPAGTLNRLSALVHGRKGTAKIVRGMQSGASFWIPGGQVAHRRFFVASGYGPLMRLNAVREELRGGRLGAALRGFAALQPSLFRNRVGVGLAGRTARCVLIGIGRLDEAFGLRPQGPRDAFEVACAQWTSLAEAAAAAPSVVLGGWRRRRGVQAAAAHSVALSYDGDHLPALLDGEAVELPSRCLVEYERRGGLVWSGARACTMIEP